jgi:hypothetical protein
MPLKQFVSGAGFRWFQVPLFGEEVPLISEEVPLIWEEVPLNFK